VHEGLRDCNAAIPNETRLYNTELLEMYPDVTVWITGKKRKEDARASGDDGRVELESLLREI
jgi:hypothetical protein